MAKVIFSAAIADMRNKLGSVVYARNRYGAYTRAYKLTVNPGTPDQLTQQAVFTTVSGTWKTLTESEREQWRQAALKVKRKDIFSNQSNLTGLQYFNKLNLEYYLVNGSVLNLPPVLREIPLFSGMQLSLNIGLSELVISFAKNNLTNQYAVRVRATSEQSQGAIFFKNLYYGITIINDATAFPSNVYAAYIAKYITFTSGTRVGIQVYAIDKTTGLRSSPINGYVDVP